MDSEALKIRTISSMIWKFAERITAQLTTTVISIILARILMPEDYGAVAIVGVFITLCNVLVSNGLGSSLIQKKNSDDIDYSTIFYTGLVLSILLYSVLFITAPFISSYYEMPILSPVLRVMGIRLIIASINSVQHAYVSKTLQFRRFFWSTLFGTVVSGVVGIIMAYQGFGIWALAFQYLTNTTIDTLFLFFTLKWRPKLIFSFDRLKGLFGFGWKIMIAALLNEIYNSLRTLIIGKMYTSEGLSFYNKGRHYPYLIATNIDNTLASVLFPVISRVQDEPTRVKSMLRRSIKTSSYFVFPMLMGLAMVAKQFIGILLTDKWLPCVPYLQIFCFSLCLAPLSSANQQATKALGRSDITMKQEIIKKTVGVIVILLTVPISVMAVVWGTVVVEFWCFVVNIFPNRKIMGYSMWEQIRDILPNLVETLTMAMCVYMVGFLPFGRITVFLLQIFVGVAVYILESVVFKNETFKYCTKTIKSIRKGKVKQ